MHNYSKSTFVKLLASVGAIALLSACGGGSGSKGSTPVVNTPITPVVPDKTPAEFKTAEYNQNAGLEAINAAEAYASGYTGQGVTIAFVDFNFNFDSTVVNWHPASVGSNQKYVDIYEAQIDDTASTTPHGQAVAIVAAGVKDGLDTHGVAYDAQVLGIDFFSGQNLVKQVEGGTTYYIANPWTYAIEKGAKIVNKSLGYDESDIIENPPEVGEAYVNEWDAYVVDSGGLLVSSAGNNGDNEPSLSNLDTIELLDENGILNDGLGAFLIVGAVDENNVIAAFSDKAGSGVSKNHYLVAPGVDIVSYWETDDDGPGYYYLSGTSFAAPHVSGAAAIIFQRWPTLSAREVADILLDTATDLGAAGVDKVYGHGLLNLDNALSPQGTVVVASGQTAAPVALSTAGLSLGPAFGDAAQLMAALDSVTVFDGYGRDFQMNLASTVQVLTQKPTLERIMDNNRRWQGGNLVTSSGSFLNYSVGQDSQPLAGLRRAGVFGEAERNEALKVDAIFEFNSQVDDQNISLGYGRSLSNAISAQDNLSGFSLVQSENGAVDTGNGPYFMNETALSDDSYFTYGMSYHSANIRHQRSQLNAPVKASNYSLLMNYVQDTYSDYALSSKGLTFGIMRETAGVLGSYSSGSLGMAEHSNTIWLSPSWHYSSDKGWGLMASLTGAVSMIGENSHSLLAEMGNIYSSSWNISAYKQGVLSRDDQLKFTLHQPLRVESAKALLTRGGGVNWDAGETIYDYVAMNIRGSGREVAAEVSYAISLNEWSLNMGLAYRKDAGHIAGRNDVMTLVSINKLF